MTKISTTPIARITRNVSLTDFDVSTSEHLVEGIVVPFDVAERVSDDGVDWYLEEVAQYAFDRQLSQPANVGRVRFVALHQDPELWIGKGHRLRRSREGLVGAWKVDRTPIAEAWLWKIADGQLPGLSMEASVYRSSARAGGGKRREELWLRHVAAVDVPAHSGAVVTTVRKDLDPERTQRRDYWRTRLEHQR